MSAGTCEWDNFQGYYLEFAITLPICIMLQLILFANSIYYEYRNQKKSGPKKTVMKLRLRLTFIFLQLSGLYFTIVELFRFVIDPPTSTLQNSIFCDILAYSPKLITAIYYGCYAYHILLRLELSFKGSYLALSKRTIILLSCITGIPCILFPILILIFSPSPCLWTWTPTDINKQFSFCAYRNYGIVNIFILLGIVYAVAMNITFSIMFTVKLKQLLSRNEDKKTSFKLKSLVVKNSILTLFGCVSTLLNYILWIALSPSTGVGAFLLYIDVYVNCLVLALMFKYNENYYKKFCKCCIVHCFMRVDKTYDQLNVNEVEKQEKRLRDYITPKEVSALFSTSPRASELPRQATHTAMISLSDVEHTHDDNDGNNERVATPPPVTPREEHE
eukprot:185021_1